MPVTRSGAVPASPCVRWARVDQRECNGLTALSLLQILDSHDLIDAQADIAWLLSCQTSVGGIAKVPDELPDVMHSYLGLAALAMHAHGQAAQDSKGTQQQLLLGPSLQALEPRLNISTESLAHLRQHLHAGPT